MVFWVGPANREGFGQVAKQIGEILKEGRDERINLVLDSNGGHVDIGFTFAGVAKRFGLRMNTCVYGTLEPALLPVFLSGQERIMGPGALILFHSQVATFGEQNDVGFERKLSLRPGTFKKRKLVEMIVALTKCSEERAWELMKDEASISAKEALELGIATGLDDFSTATVDDTKAPT